MMTTPSIEFDVPISVGEGGPVLVPAAVVSSSQVPVPPLQCARGEDASETVRLFQTALERPLAENAVLQQTLEEVVRQLSNRPIPDVRPEGIGTRPAAAPTVVVVQTPDAVVQTPDVVVQSPVEAVDRGVEVVPVVPVATPEVVVVPDLSGTGTEHLKESAGSVLEVVGDGPVAPSLRNEGGKTIDELDLVDSVVASGVRPSEMATPSVPVVETDTGKQAVSAVDAVKAAWAPVDVPKTETFLAAANAVADVLLVTPGLLRGEGEIRVHLRPDVLQGSDVRISVVGRQLGIEFIPQTADVAVLIERNRPQLEQHLATRFQAFQLSVGVRRERSREVKGRTV